MRLQETPEGLLGGETAAIVDVEVREDQCGRVTAGNRVVLNGILKAYQTKEQSLLLKTYIDGNFLELREKEFLSMDLSDEDIGLIRQLAASDSLHQQLISAVSPSIYGIDNVKEALVLQLFGGVSRAESDGSRKRGDIHILLVGDPGVAKSALLKSIINLCPRGLIVSGKGSSTAGLTASVMKDASGQFTLEAGAVVLADQGQLIIDEIDKMDERDRSALHEAMEQQCYSADTEVLTRDGWKLFSELVPTDEIATLKKNHTIEYHVPTNIISYYHYGEMISLKSRQVSLLVTPNHKLYCETYKRANIYSNVCLKPVLSVFSKRMRMYKSGLWVGKEQEEHIIPEFEVKTNQNGKRVLPALKFKMDDWLEFLGYYISEGCCPIYKNGDYYRINIAQQKKQNILLIDDCLKRMGFKTEYDGLGWNINSKQIAYHMKSFGKSCMRHVPQYVKNLSPRQIQIFLKALLLGDGHVTAKGSMSYITSSKRLANDIQELLLKVGLSGNIYTRMNVPKAKGPIYVVRTVTKNKPQINSNQQKQWEFVGYSDMVYCVDVPNHVIYVRRNGKPIWCGNCVSIAKAGICTTLQSRCSILAAANPKLGRFDDVVALAEQIDMPPTLLSRFDLIFLLLDHPCKETDRKIVDHIMMDRSVVLDRNLLRKYIAYSKQNIFPVFTDDAELAIKEYYVRVRNLSSKGGVKAMPLTPRQFEASRRLCEAAARMRLSSTVELSDAEMALRVLDSSLVSVAYDKETGTFDIDKMCNKMSMSSRKGAEMVTEIVRKHIADNGVKSVSLNEVCQSLPQMQSNLIERYLETACSAGILFSPIVLRYATL
jgi:replicative DNA helicase Mcm